MSVADALDKYVRGLKDFAWKVWRRKFPTLEDAMNYAEELDLEVQQKHVLNRGSNFGRDKPRPEQRKEPRDYREEPFVQNAWLEPYEERDEPRSDPRDFRNEPTPMELGVLQIDPPRMNDAEREHHMQQGLCFFCHKPGHRANRCPAKEGRTDDRRG